MKEAILPIELDNLGFIKDEEHSSREFWIYEAEAGTVMIELLHYEKHDWSCYVYNPAMTYDVELNLTSLTQIKNLIKALQ